jgi:single-strand DNA-binding protein
MLTHNQTTLTGRLTHDPEIRYTQTGKPVTTLEIAENIRTKQPDGTWQNTNTHYWRIQIWDKPAQWATEQLTKGQRIIAIGTLKQHHYQDHDGNQRTSYELTADEIATCLKPQPNPTQPVTTNNTPPTPPPTTPPF